MLRHLSLYFLLLLGLSACERDEQTQPAPPPTNRIDYLLVDERQERLLIYGKFPNERGTVAIDHDNLAVQSWSNALIICAIPFAEEPEYGDVVVEAEHTKSAPRRLYKWVIEFTSTRPHGGLVSDILETAHGSVAIRGDVRLAPANAFTGAYTELYELGEVYYDAGGTAQSTYDCNRVIAEWTPVHDLVGKRDGFEDLHGQTHFQGKKEILADGFDLYLDFLAWEAIPMKVTLIPCNGPGSFSEKKWSSQVIGMDGYAPIPLRFEPGTHHLKADSITQEVYNSTQLIWDVESGDAYRRTATLSWKSEQFPED